MKSLKKDSLMLFSEYTPDMSVLFGVEMLYPRLQKLPHRKSLFLFGARNTGKSTLIESEYEEATTIFIDLLDRDEQARFSRDPNELYRIVSALPESFTHVVIDEIQKVPELLDVVQRLMKKKNKYFIMTGSSARKLKKGAANLLAGRALVYNLYPLTSFELGSTFDLNRALSWGTLPEALECENDEERQAFLHAYAHTYLKEEIWDEHIVRKLEPFRRFLEVAAQGNGKCINFSNIARDVGVDDKTVKAYYNILEDTLIGFFVEPHHNSFRKRLTNSPKFYFFDIGVTRALSKTSSIPLQPQTNAYGDAFEHFVMTECVRLIAYFKREYAITYLRTMAGVEIDLIITRPGKPLLCIQIKSTEVLLPEKISSFISITKDIPDSEAICLCNEKYPKKIEHVTVLPWQMGLKQVFMADVDGKQ